MYDLTLDTAMGQNIGHNCLIRNFSHRKMNRETEPCRVGPAIRIGNKNIIDLERNVLQSF